MIHRPSQICIRKRNAAEGSLAQDLPRRGLAVFAEEKARLRAQIRVPPAIQDDPGNVTLGIESGTCKHIGKLLTDPTFVFPEGH